MHEDIQRFSLKGTVSDTNKVNFKENIIRLIDGYMNDLGYVQVLDIVPHMTLDYEPEQECYNFEISVYGTECANPDVAGYMYGKEVLKQQGV